MTIKYRVSLSGNLVAELSPTHCVGNTQSLIVPTEVMKQGVGAIKLYVETELCSLQDLYVEARNKRRYLLLNSTRDLSVTCGDVIVVGVLSYSEKPRALFTVKLLYPDVFRAETTVYGSAIRGQLRGIETHTSAGEWLKHIVQEAEEVLLKLYQDQLHQLHYADVYALVTELNI